MTNNIARIPPQSREAEQAVLGAMLQNEDACLAALEHLRDINFYFPAHRVIFSAIESLEKSSIPADIITVTDALVRMGKIEDAGGAEYITELTENIPSFSNIEYYTSIVRQKYILRKLIEVGNDIASLSFNNSNSENGNSIDEILDEAEKKIYEVSHQKNKSEFQPISDIIFTVYDEIEEASKHNNSVIGLSTGYIDLDAMLSGFQHSNLIILAARPSMGKTTLALNMASKAAFNLNVPVAMFSLEMSNSELVKKIMAQESGVSLSAIQKGMISQSDWSKIKMATNKIYNSKLFLEDTSSLTIMEIRARARKLKARYPELALIVIDYIQLISSNNNDINRQQQISDISRGLKLLARELDIPIIALSQLNRSSETRTDKRPMLSDLRESGAIEQDADVVMLLYRDDYYKKDSQYKGVTEVIIAKHRSGPTGTVNLLFNPKCSKFMDYSDQDIYE